MEATEDKEKKVRQSITLDPDLQSRVMIRFLSSGGLTGDGFNGACRAALESYVAGPQSIPPATLVNRIMAWMRNPPTKTDAILAQAVVKAVFGGDFRSLEKVEEELENVKR